MQSALERRLPRGARVQVLDNDRGAFLAAARAGVRPATPYCSWFILLTADPAVREQFISTLQRDPPAGILFTNDSWPLNIGFDAADKWTEFASLLASNYVLDQSGSTWRLYLRRTPASSGILDRHFR